MSAQQTCRECGCTETTPCQTPAGPCGWVEPDLCSACAQGGVILKLNQQDIESLLTMPPVRAQIDGFTALCLVSAIQLACRHPNFTGQTRNVVEDFARGLIERIALTDNLKTVCAAGWDATADVPGEKPSGLILPGNPEFVL